MKRRGSGLPKWNRFSKPSQRQIERGGKRRFRRLGMEKLESRRLLAGDFPVALGSLTGREQIEDFVGSVDPVDLFSFQLGAADDVAFSLLTTGEAVNLRVGLDANLNQTIDFGEDVLTLSPSAAGQAAATRSLAAGNYLAEVSVSFTTVNSQYTLVLDAAPLAPQTPGTDPGQTLDTAHDLGTLSTPVALAGQVDYSSDSSDYFRFALDQDRSISVRLGGNSQTTNVSVIVDRNGNLAVGGDEVVAQAMALVGSNQLLLEQLPAGEYYFRVHPSFSLSPTDYTLHVEPGDVLPSSVPSDPGSTFAEAHDLGALSATQTITQIVGAGDVADFYRFDVDENTRIRVRLGDTRDSLDIQLVADFNADGDIDFDDILAEQNVGPTLGAGADGWFEQDLTAGTYFLHVAPDNFDDNTFYRLELSTAPLPADAMGDPGDTLATARDLGELAAFWATEEVVSGHDRVDAYRFTVDANARVRVLLSAWSEETEVELVGDFNGDGTISFNEVLASTRPAGGDEHWFEQDLNAGVYYVLVSRYFRDRINSAYRLELSRSALPADPLGDPGDTLATARDLGELAAPWSTEEVVSGHDRTDVYQFTVDANARVRLTAAAASETVEFQLAGDFDGNGTIQSSEVLGLLQPSAGEEQWTEQDLTSGTYFVVVNRYFSDQYNSAYRLELSRSALPADPLGDPGDTLATARDLGPLGASWSTEEVVDGHDPSDYYRFTVDANTRVRVLLAPNSDTVSVELAADFGGDGVLAGNDVFASIDTNGGEQKWLEQDLTAGVYYVHVSRYFNNQRNSAYRLELSQWALPSEPLGDPGDTLLTALDLGQAPTTWSTEEVVSGYDVADYYKFTVDSNARVRVLTAAESKTIYVDLVGDFNGDGSIDSTEDLATVTPNAGVETWFEQDLTPGTYYARVFRYNNDQYNSAYRLELSRTDLPTDPLGDPGDTPGAARDLGTLSAGQTVQDVVGGFDPDDYYTFTLASDASIWIDFSNLHESAYYRLLDGDGVSVLDTDVVSPPDVLRQNYHLTAGTYYVRISPYTNGYNTAYRLDLRVAGTPTSPADPGDTLATAHDIGVLGGEQAFLGSVAPGDASDLYRFTLTQATRVDVLLDQLAQDADLRLIADVNGDGVWDSAETIEESNSSGTSPDFLTEELAAGTYFLAVEQGFASVTTSYRLTVWTDPIAVDPAIDPGETPGDAHDVGMLATDDEVSFVQLVGATDEVDFYQFQLSGTTRLRAWTDGVSELAYLYVIADLNGDGQWTRNGETLQLDETNGSNFVTEDLGAGTYFVAVARSNSSVRYNSAYRLTLRTETIPVDPTVDPGETPATAHDLGVLTGGSLTEVTQFVGATDSVDVYRFEVTTAATIRAWTDHVSEYAYLYLAADLNGDGQWTPNEETLEQDFANGNGFLAEDIVPGTYFLIVAADNNAQYNSAYRLTLGVETIPTDPTADPGDTPATAYDVGLLSPGSETSLRQGIGLTDDADFYRFELDAPARLRAWTDLVREFAYLHVVADLNGNGEWDSGETLESDTGTGNNAVVEELGPGTYFIAVTRQQSDDWNSSYRLTLRTEAIEAAPVSDPGESPDTAYNVGVLPPGGEASFRQLVGATDTADLYRIDLDVPTRLRAWTDLVNEYAYLYIVADLNGNGEWDSGETLESDTGAGGNFVTEDLAAGTYYVAVAPPVGGEYNDAYRLTLRAEEIPTSPSEDPGEIPSTATDLGDLSSGVVVQQTFGAEDASDFYTFTLDRIEALQLHLRGITDNVQLALFADLNGDGAFSSAETLATMSIFSSRNLREELGPGTYFVRVQGFTSEVNTAYTLELRTSPVVFDSPAVGPAVASVAAVGPGVTSAIDVTFTAAINALSFTVGDVTLEGPAGTVTIDSIETINATTYRLHFAPPTASGLYSLTIGPDITNGASQPMNQDRDRFAGEAVDDAYRVQLPIIVTDLAVDAVQIVESTATFGSSINVSYTIRNAGAVAQSTPWVDRVWLSDDMTLDASDLLLGQFASDGELPLAAGATYTRNESFALPLITNLPAGDYYVLVRTDAADVQPELDETNNAGLDGPLALSHPPLPDLQVVSIDAPIEVFAGQQAPVSWTLGNLGDGEAAGTFSDRLYLSFDDQLGSDYFLGTFAFTGVIPAGDTVERTQLISFPSGISGPYYLLVVTDVSNQIYERDAENNNLTASATSVDLITPPSPNLQVASVTAPPAAFSDQEVVVSWVVENTGDAPTSAAIWYDSVYLSNDPQFNPFDDQFLGNAKNPGYLAPGDSYANSLSITLPRGIDGDYYLIVRADVTNYVVEINGENDNTGAGGPIDVQLTPPPDLTVSSVLAPGLGLSGQPIIVRWTVANQGPADIVDGSWTDAVYLSRDDQLDGGDTRLGTRQRDGGIAFNDSYTAEGSFVLPEEADGSYFIIVTTDKWDSVYEHNQETNNTGVAANSTNVTPVRSDLEVLTVDAPTTVRAGTHLSVSYRVENRGVSVTTSTRWTDALYLSTDATFDPGSDLRLSQQTHHGPLEPDQSYEAEFNLLLSQQLSGTFYVFVATDAFGGVLELDDDNNAAGAPAQLVVESRPADLTSQIDALQANVSAGATLQLSWSVLNQGIGDTITDRWTNEVYLSADATFGNGDDRLLARRDHVGLLAPGEDAAVNGLVVQIPFDVAPGSYHVFVETDATNRVFEAGGEGNNVSSGAALTVNRMTSNLEVDALTSPAAADAGTFINVSWTVANTGPVATESLFWHDAVYLSRDAVPGGGDDVLLGTLQHNNALASGAQYTASTMMRLRSNLDGEYYLYVVTDVGDRVLEDPSESDNVRISPTPIDVHYQTVTPPPPAPPPNFPPTADPVPEPTFPPDLEVVSVDAPAGALSGQLLEVSWTVRNNGYDADGWSWSDAVYLSLDQTFDLGSDVSLGYVNRPAAALPGGGQYSQTASFTIPQGLAGPYYVFVATDAGRRIAEENEFDNAGYDGSSLDVALPAPVDLAVGVITVPATGEPGQSASFTYQIDNLGSEAALGSWTDTLYLSSDDAWDVNDVRLGSVLHLGDVAGGGSYSETLIAPLPGVVPGQYHVIVRSDIRNQIIEGDESNNVGGSLQQVVLDVPALTLGVAANGSLAEDQFVYYKVEVPGGEALQIQFDSASADAANELYLRYGAMPSRTEYDLRFDDAFQADQQILAPVTRAGTYYVMAYGDRVDEATAAFTLQADILGFGVEAIDVVRGSNQGRVTLTVSGAKYTTATEVELVHDSGLVRGAEQVRWIDDSTLWATFDLRGLEVSTYDVQVVEGPQQAALDDAFQVTSGPLGSLQVTVEAPSRLLTGQSGFATIRYVNIGETDVPASVLIVDADNANLVANGELAPIDGAITLLAVNPDGPAGILPPGAEHTILIPFDPTIANGTIEVRASDLGEGDTPLDWDALRETLRPPGMQDEAWEVVWNRFRQQVGSTVAELEANLSENATYLSQIGVRTQNVFRLLGFELSQADNTLPGPVLLQSVDASASVPGLPLVFGRVAHQNLAGRYALGPFGRGWTHNWDYQATTDDDGNVLIWANGALRTFIRQADDSYRGLPGDNAELTLVDTGSASHYLLRQSDGLTLGFLLDGRLSFLQDANGNRIDAGYTAGRLTSLTHTSGASFTIDYNADGRIRQLTDDVGRITTYSYDASSQYLEQAATEQGVTAYTYNTSGPDVLLHALRSATGPDGVSVEFDYDAQGRLAGQSLTAGAQALTFSYGDVGLVTTTDLSGATIDRYYDDSAQVRLIRDPVGGISRFEYDAAGNLVILSGPMGVSSNLNYDERGNPAAGLDPLGNATQLQFDPDSDRLLGVRNPNDEELSYAYDARGNLTAITYADGSQEHFEYDAIGQVTRSVNRRGQGIDYTYDARGRLTHKEYDDGTTFDFSYNARGDLETATDAAGQTTLTYDALDRLTGIAYPGGRSLTFTYDAGGRRTSSVDQDGFTVNYRYDALGRLVELTDVDDERIVLYTYDALGRLLRKDQGNDTYTTYGYDPAGRITQLVNHRPDDSVNSSFAYTYDALGRQTSVTTLDGTTSYDYDLAGQLVGVHLPGGRTITYAYDDNGNRLLVTDGGVTTFYTTNGLDQYTQVGAAIYSYDADGNLTQIVDGGDISTYSYDAENQLVSAVTPQGSWAYEYDAFGNRIAAVLGGDRTEYLIDPVRFGNVVGEYSGGAAVANYVHGLGLTSRVDVVGGATYSYDFDFKGSTVGLTDASGDYVNQYSYLPFGESLSAQETLSNPFRFVGQWGVMSAATDLLYMNVRDYNPLIGKFHQTDPIGVFGGNNLTAYAFNSPVILIDPSGLRPFEEIYPSTDPNYYLNSPEWVNDNGLFDREHLVNPDTGSPRTYSFRERTGWFTDWTERGQITFFEDGTVEYSTDVFGVYGPEVTGDRFWDINPFAWVIHGFTDWVPFKVEQIWNRLGRAVIRIAAAFDPNDIIAPEGVGDEHWVSAFEPLNYTVRFENDPVLATAPARVVRVTQQLDFDLDPRSVRIRAFGFGDTIVEASSNQGFYTDRLDLRASHGVYLDVIAAVDVRTAQLFWEFTAIDPATGAPPLDPDVGFLPPNLDGSEGQGFVNYSVRAKDGTVSGTVVEAEARIVFDTNPPIDTPRVFNTLDGAAPDGDVSGAADEGAGVYTVSWDGADEDGGSGIAGFDVYVAQNGGPFQPWITGTTLRSSLFAGDPAATYAFYSVGVDRTGNRQAAPLTVDVIASNDVSPPGVDVEQLTPSLIETPPQSIVFTFSEPVTGFGLGDLSLTLDGAPISLAGATLSLLDATTFQLGNVASLTAAPGRYELTLTAAASGIADPAGNPLNVGGTTAWRLVDAAAGPARPALTGLSRDTGAPGDGLTSDPTIILSGVANAGATVTITRLGVGVVGMVAPDASGVWSFDYSGTPLPDGEHIFVAVAGDGQGATSAASDEFTVVVDRLLLGPLDYGDAPDVGAGVGPGDYQTTEAGGGPTHSIVAGLRLGDGAEGDDGTLQDSAADADDNDASDDENGLLTPLDSLGVVGAQPVVMLRATNTTGGAATLFGWIDYNQDGVFDNATERAEVDVPNGQVDQQVTLLFPEIPDGSAGATYARFRLSTDVAAAANPTGAATDGEVEDYAVTILQFSPFMNSSDPYDVDVSGEADFFDILAIIADLRAHGLHRVPGPPGPTDPPPFTDVNNDLYTNFSDILAIISYLRQVNSQGGAEGEALVSAAAPVVQSPPLQSTTVVESASRPSPFNSYPATNSLLQLVGGESDSASTRTQKPAAQVEQFLYERVSTPWEDALDRAMSDIAGEVADRWRNESRPEAFEDSSESPFDLLSTDLKRRERLDAID
ncbi:MAG: CARDB domain-containing protein [Pirellulaceae bacterium]